MDQPAPPQVSSEELAGLSGIYRLLARLWLRELDEPLLHELRSPALAKFFVQAGGLLPPNDHPRTIEELAQDYCQLFIGPRGHLPPYQSVWQSGQFQSETTRLMQELLDAARYVPAPPYRATMLDHLGLQMDAMAHITATCAAVQGSARELSLELGQRFFAQHLTWPASLLAAAGRQANSEFYRSVIQITSEFLQSDRDWWIKTLPSAS